MEEELEPMRPGTTRGMVAWFTRVRIRREGDVSIHVRYSLIEPNKVWLYIGGSGWSVRKLILDKDYSLKYKWQL